MTKEHIIQLEEELRQAMLNADVNKLNELISETLVYTTHTGTLVNKQMDIYAHKNGIIKFSKLEPSDQSIQYYHNYAIVTVKMFGEGSFDDNPFSSYCRFTRVWGIIKDQWQVVAGHACIVTE